MPKREILIDLARADLLDGLAAARAASVDKSELLTEAERGALAQYLSVFKADMDLVGDWPGVQALMKEQFCGFPDPAGLGTSSAPLSYTLAGRARRPLNLSYTVVPSDESAAITQVAKQCFDIWSFAAPALTPEFRASGPVDLTFDLRALDAPRIGETSPDGSRISVTPGLSRNPKFARVLLHEIGHALGLLHSTNAPAVMYPFANRSGVLLTDDDVSAIRSMYGWTPQKRIEGRGTDTGPALCGFMEGLMMTWKGHGDDNQIWFSTSADGIRWTDQAAVPTAYTSDQPALATRFDGSVIMAFVGPPGDGGLYWMVSLDGKAWGPLHKVDGVGSSHGPSLGWQSSKVPESDVLFMAWKGWDDDTGLYFSRLIDKNWSPQTKVGGVGSADRPALATDVDGSLRMTWRGVPGDNILYTSVLRDLFWDPQELVQWIIPGNGGAGTAQVAHALSEFGPAACSRFRQTYFVGEAPPTDNKVFLVWRGDDNEGLYFTQLALDVIGTTQASRWSSQVNVPRVASSHRPSMALYNSVMHFAWKGAGSDTGIYSTRLASR